ncbi:cytochrome P450, partial [Stereum hirsutum FP-91666 SS1]|uniref:cytochrome P450 n=1 Tax=Stereum hirsutum (strain FP-91666) TaxID=721885 RepID=UPI000444A0CD
ENERKWMAYSRWSKESGPLVTLSTAPHPMMVVSGRTVIRDLLIGKKSFCCRPRIPMAELMGRQNNVGFTYYGKRLIAMRTLLHSALSLTEVTSTWMELINYQADDLCRDFIVSPERFYGHVEANIQKLIGRFTYGHEPSPEYLQMAAQVSRHTGKAVEAGRWAVNSIPARTFHHIVMWVPAWMPGAGFKRYAIDARKLFTRLLNESVALVKQRIDQNEADTSFVKQSLTNISLYPSCIDESLVISSAGSLFSGMTLLSGTILSFIVLMANHEDFQDRAYAEILSVVGTDRFPNCRDRPSLIFVDALIREVYRFNPIVPVIHRSNYEEEEYEEHFIPKKTWILVNLWSILHDPNVYPSPETFCPERFLNSDKDINPDPRSFVYGFGRRRCPAVDFADTTLFITITRLLMVFKISPEIVDGIAYPPLLEIMEGFTP